MVAIMTNRINKIVISDLLLIQLWWKYSSEFHRDVWSTDGDMAVARKQHVCSAVRCRTDCGSATVKSATSGFGMKQLFSFRQWWIWSGISFASKLPRLPSRFLRAELTVGHGELLIGWKALASIQGELGGIATPQILGLGVMGVSMKYYYIL